MTETKVQATARFDTGLAEGETVMA